MKSLMVDCYTGRFWLNYSNFWEFYPVESFDLGYCLDSVVEFACL